MSTSGAMVETQTELGWVPADSTDWRALVAALVKALRPVQWAKNGLVFIPLAFTNNLLHAQLTLAAALTFIIFCALSSAGYVLNDLADIEADRAHPVKRHRPIASGRVPVAVAATVGVLLAVGGVAGAFSMGPAMGALGLGYLLLTACYTVWLKHLMLLDIFGIAAGFVVRAAAGAVAIAVPVSPWLYTATMLGALLIALGKRRAELRALGTGVASTRRILQDYSLEFVDQLILIISGAALMTYALYTFSAENLPKDHSMMLTVPVVLYGLFRYLFLVRDGGLTAAPEDMLLKDRPLLAAAALWAVLAVAILTFAGAR